MKQVVFDTVVTYYELTFENQGYIKKMEAEARRKDNDVQPIKASIIFEMFPFCILYNVSSFTVLSTLNWNLLLAKYGGDHFGRCFASDSFPNCWPGSE